MNMAPKCRSVQDSASANGKTASTTGRSHLQMLHNLRFEYPKSLLCGYLNINSLRNKIHY